MIIPFESLICEDLLVTTGKKNLDYKDFMELLIVQLYNANQQNKRLEKKSNRFKYDRVRMTITIMKIKRNF